MIIFYKCSQFGNIVPNFIKGFLIIWKERSLKIFRAGDPKYHHGITNYHLSISTSELGYKEK